MTMRVVRADASAAVWRIELRLSAFWKALFIPPTETPLSSKVLLIVSRWVPLSTVFWPYFSCSWRTLHFTL